MSHPYWILCRCAGPLFLIVASTACGGSGSDDEGRENGGSAVMIDHGDTGGAGGGAPAAGGRGEDGGGGDSATTAAADPYNADCSSANWAGVDPRCWECLCETCPAEINACDEGCVSILECTFENGCLVNDASELGCEVQCVAGVCLDTPERQASVQGILDLDTCIISAAGSAGAGEFRACESVCEIPYPGDVCERHPAM